MEDEESKILNNTDNLNNNDLLKGVVKKLEKIVKDINEKKENDTILTKINEVITTINDVINDNKTNIKQMKKEIISIIGENKTKTYKNGKYKGEFKNDLKDGKGIYYYNDENRYEGEWKNDLKEGESCCIKIHREQERNRVPARKMERNRE
mgnify:CR=1 FL=1